MHIYIHEKHTEGAYFGVKLQMVPRSSTTTKTNKFYIMYSKYRVDRPRLPVLNAAY